MVLNLYDHTVRKALCLSLNEYAVACEVWALSNNEAYSGWCIKSKENISNTLDLSRPTIQKIINTLEDKSIIKRKNNGWIRTVDEFNSIMSTRDVSMLIDGDFSVLSICKESLQPSVKKVNTDCKESLQLGVKKVNTSITVSNNKSNNKIKSKGNTKKTTAIENEQQAQQVNSPIAVNKSAVQSELIAEFENFRKNYKGTKRGLEIEFKDFKRHKDFSSCIDLLLPALEREEEQRQLAENSGKFFPARKHLKTWLYQRCWENEIEETKQQSEQELVAEFQRIGFIDFKRKYGNQKAIQIDFITS